MKHVLLGVALLTPFFPAGQAADTKGPDPRAGAVIAEVDGVKVTRAEFERKNPAKLFQAKNGFYELEKKALEEYIEQYLLEREAKKENVTVTQLLEKHVDSKLPPDPSDDALKVYYEGIDTKEPFDSIKDKIVSHLRDRRKAKLKTEYLTSLREKSQIAIRLGPPRMPIELGNTPLRGNANAPLLLVEYADYECPYCQQIQPALEKIQAEYRGKLAFAYKDVPLPNHANAFRAAEASHCAGDQGKYWEYHDALNQSKQYAVPSLKETARSLKLDAAAFDKCLDSGVKAPLIKAQLNEAQSLGIQGTPSFFLNGRFFSGSLSYEQLRALVEEELKAVSETQRAGVK